ncbi:putative transcription factor C2C2-CO-like family [Helianthus anomalus]
MSSTILTGGTGRAYGFDIENVVKSPSMTSSRNSHSSSPSSTLSESSNSPIAISNRKPRTPRKRPNQTYNEAAVLLSIACPKVFSNKNLTNKTNNLSKFTTQKGIQNGNSVYDPPELLLPFPVIENSGFLLRNPIPKKPNSVFESKVAGSCQSPEEFEYQNCNSGSNSMEMCDGFEGVNLGATVRLLPCDLEVTGSSLKNNLFHKNRVISTSGPSWPNITLDPTHAEVSCTDLLNNKFEDDFDTESMLDEEIEEGIDSIMGSSNSTIETRELNNDSCLNYKPNTCYGYPLGLGFGGNLEFNFGMGMKNGIRALKNGDDGNWWNFPTVNVADVSPRVAVVAPVKVKKNPNEKKKKKKRVEELLKRSESELELEFEQGNKNNGDGNGCKLLLKLNYDDVLNAWSDKGSPLPEEISGSESADGDIHTRLAQIDLFSESGGLREASVMRYKEKKRTRLFSKKIRYQVRKVNADRRPRSKGRFVRRSNSEDT